MAPVQVRRLADAAAFTRHLASLGVDLPFDPEVDVGSDSPLAQPLEVRDGSAGTLAVGNRWAVLPMEGWDATIDGRPTDLVRRRWARFGGSGAKLVWGGEAVAVGPDGRANPNQLCIGRSLGTARERCCAAHRLPSRPARRPGRRRRTERAVRR